MLDLQFQVIKRWRGWHTYPGSSGENPHEDEGVKGKQKAKAKERGVILLECGGVLLGIGVSPALISYNCVTSSHVNAGFIRKTILRLNSRF